MRTSFSIITIVLLLCLSAFAQKPSNSCYNNLSSDDFNLLIETNEVILIDGRLFKEYRKERIANALIAAKKESLKIILNNIDKNTYILVYCEIGYRSRKMAEIICSELNFNNVYNLERGIKEWEKKGYPIDNEKLTKIKD